MQVSSTVRVEVVGFLVHTHRQVVAIGITHKQSCIANLWTIGIPKEKVYVRCILFTHPRAIESQGCVCNHVFSLCSCWKNAGRIDLSE